MLRMLLLAAALVAAPQAALAGTLDRIKESGVVRIGYRADAKPYSYQDRGRPAGFIVDLCAEVAAALGPGIRTEYIVVSAAERFEAVRDRRIDILCDPSSVTLARREMVDFSLPTFLDGASALSRTSKPVRKFEDMAGKRIGVLAGTTTENTLRESLANLSLDATIVPVSDHRAGMELVWTDQIDTYFADRAIIAAMLGDGGRPGFTLSRQYFSYETYALAVPRDDGAFRLVVDRTLSRLYRSGRINVLLTKTFGNRPLDELLKAMFAINAVPEK